MRLIVSKTTGRIIDIVGCKKCPTCTEWFYPQYMHSGYCNICRRHYQRWRHRQLRMEKASNGKLVADTSVDAFRAEYTAGLLDMKPWTWPGETEIPVGAVDPGI